MIDLFLDERNQSLDIFCFDKVYDLLRFQDKSFFITCFWEKGERDTEYSSPLSEMTKRFIMLKHLYKVYPLTSHFYIVKQGFTGVCIFYFCSKTECGYYRLEPPH